VCRCAQSTFTKPYPSFKGVAESQIVLSESLDAAEAVLTEPVLKTLRELDTRLLQLSVSDQPPFRPRCAQNRSAVLSGRLLTSMGASPNPRCRAHSPNAKPARMASITFELDPSDHTSGASPELEVLLALVERVVAGVALPKEVRRGAAVPAAPASQG